VSRGNVRELNSAWRVVTVCLMPAGSIIDRLTRLVLWSRLDSSSGLSSFTRPYFLSETRTRPS